MTAPTDWLSAVIILVSGLALGALFIFAFRRRRNAAANTSNERLELEATRDALVAQLRELDGSDPATADDRARLERETADVLRQLDKLGKPPAPAAPSKANPAIKGFVWGMGTTMVLAGLALYVYISDTKTAPASAEHPAGMQQASMQQTVSPKVQELEEAVRNDPDNADLRMALARTYFETDNFMGTFEQTRAVLAKNPNEPRAMTWNAIVRMAMGQLDDAKGMLETATKLDPTLLDAWVALASARTDSGDDTGAAAAIDAAIAQHPEQEQRLRDVLIQMRSANKAAVVSPEAAAQQAMNPDMPPDHPPLHTEPAVASGSTAKPIRITLALGESAKAKQGIVYVIARAEGASGGHPVAVKRIDANAFPLSLDLSAADAMMGQPFPATVRVEARLDSDGDAGTNEPGDPKAFVEGVTAGAALLLKLE